MVRICLVKKRKHKHSPKGYEPQRSLRLVGRTICNGEDVLGEGGGGSTLRARWELPGPSQCLQSRFIDVVLLGSPNTPNQRSLVQCEESQGNPRRTATFFLYSRTSPATKACDSKEQSGENTSKKQIFKDSGCK